MFPLNHRVRTVYIFIAILAITIGENGKCVCIGENVPGIHGGDEVNITEVPFMAMYRPHEHKHWCGASIVHERFLVSAAHCYKTLERLNLTGHIIVGTDKVETDGEIYEIKQSHLHPKLNYTIKDYDIVVLELEKPLQFSDRVQPINLADKDVKVEDGAILDAMGFGKTENDTFSNQLLKVSIPLVSSSKCKQDYPQLTERMICAGSKGADSCQGDSGGPLRFKDMLLGIVSYGKGCGVYPGVYTSIPVLRDFIDEIIARNS